mmetsp:Transcript_43452/g.70497  ORF Transcript_43452/g.70497 Transcript_43452/m.70497 type:complete len:672 (-) Transcript_43452:398-2413(-)
MDNNVFDVVVLGTGLPEAIVAGALSLAGSKVLHLDYNDFYGDTWGSVTLYQIQRHLARVRDDEDDMPPSQSSLQINEYDKEALYEVTLPPPADPRDGFRILPGSVGGVEWSEWEQRDVNIDLSAKLVYCHGSLVPALIRSAMSSYLSFRPMERIYMYASGAWHKVPSSKGDIFSSRLLSLLEKRALMKFLNACLDYSATPQAVFAGGESSASVPPPQPAANSDFAVAVHEYSERPFTDFLSSRGLSSSAQSFVCYAVALATSGGGGAGAAAAGSTSTTRQGIAAVVTYLTSLGRYGSGTMALMAPQYGVGDFSQAFCRLCAVYGGTYILRRGVQALLVERDKEHGQDKEGQSGLCRGVICSDGSIVHTKWVVASPSSVLPLLSSSSSSSLSHQQPSSSSSSSPSFPSTSVPSPSRLCRCVCLTDKSLVPSSAATSDAANEEEDVSALSGGDLAVMVVPPSVLGGNPHPVHIVQFDYSVGAAPAGKFVVHFTMSASSESARAEDDLTAVVKHFLNIPPPPPSPAVVHTQYQQATTEDSSPPPPPPTNGDARPHVLWGAFFELLPTVPQSSLPSTSSSTAPPSLPPNVLVGPFPSPSIDADEALDTAEKMFRAILPDKEFLPRREINEDGTTTGTGTSHTTAAAEGAPEMDSTVADGQAQEGSGATGERVDAT